MAEADRAQDEPHPRVRFSHDLKEVYGAEREEEAGKGSL